MVKGRSQSADPLSGPDSYGDYGIRNDGRSSGMSSSWPSVFGKERRVVCFPDSCQNFDMIELLAVTTDSAKPYVCILLQLVPDSTGWAVQIGPGNLILQKIT